ncbi:hypothetical protein CLV47_102152 [Antricoccus suffuscus]|uniref:PH (Pleckstrin Homology) domain-containing protein n=1 Tax=Antricoccus suffuscus TaxID=1629062 RepID=A0A2T1A4D4_9ACTN|nr:hypothetical protein [Antricoccus suffuscus]PRZ43466.1 hypothetical protein CLV47_102152 [Antricoccus suffuscus]
MTAPDNPRPTPPPLPAGQTIRVRYTRTSLLALGVAAICALPAVGTFWPWSMVVYLILAVFTYCVLRVGANITADVVSIRGPFYSRRIARRQVAGLSVSKGGGVFLLRTNGSRILIPTARPRDLPRLRAFLFNESAKAEPSPDLP